MVSRDSEQRGLDMVSHDGEHSRRATSMGSTPMLRIEAREQFDWG
jgi:hypothetical protein